MRQFLPLLSLLLLPAFSHAQTKPEKVVPLESRSESRALVQRLLREGKIMSPKQARRGMKGYALSVFQGTKVERFGVVVLGTLERVQGGGDLVLIRVTDGPVIARQSGIIQGMSGSPVYLNGKLLGAIAIGFGFPKEPIGGVTPITQMITTALPNDGPKVAPAKTAAKIAASEIYRPTTPLTIQNRRIARLEVTRDPALSDFSGPSHAATLRLRPATQLLQLSGVSAGSLGRWKAMLEPYGISPVIGGGAMSSNSMGNRQVFGAPSKKTGVSANLAPGAAIGVQLASGDIDATGVGTVTYRVGNRVLAFGHPMFGLGAISMPMTTAYVHDIFPAYDISFKLASPISSVGELQQDTIFAIGGTIGRRAETVPMRIHLRDAAKKIDRKFNVRLIKDPLFTPQLARAIAVEALQSTLGLDSDKTVRIAYSIGLKNGPAIRRVNTVYAADQVIAGALGEVLDTLALTQANPFEKGALTSLDMRVEVVQGRKTARIRRLYTDKNRVKAGEKVQISVVLEPTGRPDEEFTRRFTVEVPADAPSGTLRVVASSAGNFFSARARVGGPPPNPGNFKELLEAYSQVGADNVLLLQTSTPRRFLMIDRKRVVNPPPTWNRLVPAGPSSSISTFNETQEQRESMEWVLSGLESVSIPVESNRSTDRERPDSASGEEASSANPTARSEATSDDEMEADEGPVYVSAPPRRAELDGAPDFARRAAPLLRVLMQIPAPKPAPPVTIDPAATPTPAPSPVPITPPVPTTTPTPTPAPSADANANTIARPSGRWIQNTGADFGRGKFDGAIVSNDGTIRVGPQNRRVVSSAEPIAWSVAADGRGTIYLGTGLSARLLKIENGASKVLYEGPEVAITALALGGDGHLYAGASPGGRVYRFAPDGAKTTILESGQTFVHALAFDGAGNLLVATGGEAGKVFRVATPATVSDASLAKTRVIPLATLPQKHARSLAVSGDSIYAGTGDDAVLYRIESGQVAALYQATGGASPSSSSSAMSISGPTIVLSPSTPQSPGATLTLGGGNMMSGEGSRRAENEILSLAVAGENVYFGTANSGSIWRWNAKSGVSEAFKTPARAIYALRFIDGALWAATGESGEVWRVTNLDGDVQGARVLDATQPQVLALASVGNRVFAATGNNAAVYEIGGAGGNSFVSNVFDAGQIVRFGALRAIGEGATFEFRSGNTLEPDATWSDWKTVQNGEGVGAQNARYAQYRVRLNEGGTLSRVEIAYRAPNRAPRVSFTTPGGGEAFSGKKTLAWSGSDPDKDTLRYHLELRGADGKSQKVDLTSAVAPSQEIDTKKFADGTYTARIVASDAARNPEDPRSDVAFSQPFVIDNTAPLLATPAVVKDGAAWNVSFGGTDALSPLAGAEWRLAAGTAKGAKPADWQAAAASDGLFDSRTETVVARLDPLIAGLALKSGDAIELRLRDAAGNQSTTKITLP
ncbi:MAG: hypothetical protein KY445_00385 [Armatimonadetes bacterium]|nr:hypothetical protein [Armatimonadota bacterium]